MDIRIQDAIARLGHGFVCSVIERPSRTANEEDADLILDIVVSWWVDGDGWVGTEEDISREILEEFPNHKVTIELMEQSISYTITGPRINLSCITELAELESETSFE